MLIITKLLEKVKKEREGKIKGREKREEKERNKGKRNGWVIKQQTRLASP
jgi:hypothetical protein